MEDDLEQRALTAASAIAAAHGLAHGEPVVVHSASNVLVHLRPAPVVARVMTGTVALHNEPSRWLEREISVLAFLAPSGLAVAPSSLIAPGPHHHEGLWMTFSEWIPDAEPASHRQGAHRLGRALRNLHDELRPFDGELGGLRDLGQDIERLHGQLRAVNASEAERTSALRARLRALQAGVFESELPTQALHGDVSLGNLLCTSHRLVWNDFEDTFRGPVHWDVASYVISLRNRGADSRFVRAVLDAYGWDEANHLAPFFAAHAVYDDIWGLYDQQRQRRD